MRTITLEAPGKINLTLDVLGLLPDGYHELETIFQSVDIYDELRIDLLDGKTDTVEVNLQCHSDGNLCVDFPLDDRNLIVRAARAFASAAGCGPFAVNVSVWKLLPIGGGMAGGSTDGAAVLIGLNELFGKPLSADQIAAVGGKLGADVPFCLAGGTMLGRGKGDELSALENNCELALCVVKPRDLSVSTPWAFSSFDAYKGKIDKPDTAGAIEALRSGDLDKLMQALGNVFQPVVFKEHPDLQALSETLYDLGSWYCQMTGSGPTLFSIVANRQMAHRVRRRLLRNDDDGFIYGAIFPTAKGPPWDFHIAETINHGVRVVRNRASVNA